MALNAAQQIQVNTLKALLDAKDLEIRRDYPATFSSNGKLFFDFFADIKAQITKIEQA